MVICLQGFAEYQDGLRQVLLIQYIRHTHLMTAILRVGIEATTRRHNNRLPLVLKVGQTPLAELGDGLLDITVIPDIPIWTIAKEVPRLFTGTFHKVDVLTMVKCREVIVMPDGEADAEPAEVDGEVVGRAPVRMTVLDEQIRVVMPDLH